MKLKKKMRIELASAVAMTILLSCLAALLSLPRQTGTLGYSGLNSDSLKPLFDRSSGTTAQVHVDENIQGELNKGSFEEVIEGLRNITLCFGGKIPNMNMVYENDLWRGTTSCKVPTDNVTSFTFDVRRAISQHGKVTHITISVTETEINQSNSQQTPMSDVTIGLNEVGGGGSLPWASQIGTVVSWLSTCLTWIAQGLILGVPLCFVSLGVVALVDRGIVPLWRKQFKSKKLNQTTTTS